MADDAEGKAVPSGLPPIVDAHCHLFPDRMFEAIWRWFDEHGWEIRYKLHADAVVEFQRSRGVSQLVGLHYAHMPGIARGLNQWMAEFQRRHAGVTGVATVYPGEEHARQILAEGFMSGLRGVKLHCHVQCFSPDDASMHPVYLACCDYDQPLVMHAGREPRSRAYKIDTYEICAVERVEKVLREFPKLKLIVPHLGADECDGYERLLDRYDNLWLDTTMAIAEYFPFDVPEGLVERHPDRILFGTDFPNLPYAWDRELVKLANWGLPPDALRKILGGNARALFGISEPV
jgi:predicted TIM-barrel fold metal-dependent hydrolase